MKPKIDRSLALKACVLGIIGLALAATISAPPAWADDAAPPARAIRLSSVDGQVQLSQGKQLLANPAIENTPLFEGSLVTTGDDGRAEIQFEDGSVVRLSPNSSVTLSVLRGQGSSAEAEIAIESGLVYFELQGAGLAGAIKVKFADAAVTASGLTVLRVNLDTPPGDLAVFSGNAHIDRGDALSLDVHGGETVALNGTDPSHFNLTESIEPDSWDAWNADRDEASSAQGAARTGATRGFSDSGNPAWSDLDANGSWYNVPDQGYIWSPSDAASGNFDPYGNGNWMWTPGYGYIWVSGYQWGYTPFQCGTWNYYDAFGWGWAPGINGCQPWWNGGGYGVNLGVFPVGYHGPIRPPHPPLPPGGGRGPHHPFPMVPVNRHGSGGATTLPARDRTSVVSIGGYTVQALHPLSPRPQYDHSGSAINVSRYPNGTSVHSTGSSGSHGGVLITPAPSPSAGRTSAPTAGRAPSSAPAPTHAPSSSGGGHPAPSSGGGGGGGHAAPSSGSGGGHH